MFSRFGRGVNFLIFFICMLKNEWDYFYNEPSNNAYWIFITDNIVTDDNRCKFYNCCSVKLCEYSVSAN